MLDVWSKLSRQRRIRTCLVLLHLAAISLPVKGFSVQWQQRYHRRIISPAFCAKETLLPATKVEKRNFTSVQSERRPAPNKRTALRWVVQSIERLGQDPEFILERPSPQLMDALYRLQKGENIISYHVPLIIFVLANAVFCILARTQREVTEAGRLLESLDITRTESADVQERVVKAAAISGLLTLATQLLDGFLDREVFPSSIAYVAVCNSLRQAGRAQRLEQVLYKLGSVAHDEPVSVVALNTYLAALCDGIQDRSRLEHARDWLRPGVSSERLGGTEPDEASYATVLHAASSMENHCMVDELWDEMTITRKLHPTVYAYNALLQSARGCRNGDAKVLDLLDRLWKEVRPDRYTIDLVLVPLIRAHRIGDVEALLGSFVESCSVDTRTASNAFSAFLNTLIKAGELPTARAIFDTYLLPSLSSSDPNINIYPTTWHFNLLIDGYRRVSESDRADEHEQQEDTLIGSSTYGIDPDRILDARGNGLALYETMLNAGIAPDAYTLTSMLGLSSTTAQVTNVFRQIVFEYGVQVTPAVLRAAMIAYGTVGDVPSACILFDEFSAGTTNSRTWNALMSALAKGAIVDSSNAINMDSSAAATALMQTPGINVLERGVCKLVDGHTCYDAIQRVLCVMERGGDQHVDITQAPHPNSQTYCITASALQHGPANSDLAMELFRNATRSNLPADGRFVNAILRCFGNDIDGALYAWKNEIRRSCLAYEHRRRLIPPSKRRAKGKNLIASYHGLLYVCGRALRPDIAVRLVYAMNKDGIEPNEVALNCYRSGKRMREKLAKLNNEIEKKGGLGLAISQQFESILLVECTKFDENDKRRAGEKRVRIIF